MLVLAATRSLRPVSRFCGGFGRLPSSRRSFLLHPARNLSCPRTALMASGVRSRDPNQNPKVSRLREIMSGETSDGWEKCWEDGVTPWDLGQVTPIVARLVRSGDLPDGRVLVPGCGAGYDVIALASPKRFVVGLDISNTAVQKAEEWSSSLPNSDCFTFLTEDFFAWNPSEKFDLIFDYTFFCAIDPSMRLSWAEKIDDLLKPNGELITLIYVLKDQEAGPPFNNTLADYESVLHPRGFVPLSIEDNHWAIEKRKGSELLVRWKCRRSKPSL